MKCRCPKCGSWTEATKHSIIDNASETYNQFAKTGKDIGKVLGSPFGKLGKTVGGKVGDAIGSVAGIGGGIFAGTFGDKYQFLCPNCGEEWSTSDEAADETDLFTSTLSQAQEESVYHDIDCLNELWVDNVDKDAVLALINDIENRLPNISEDYLGHLEQCTIAVAYYLIDDNRNALKHIEKAINIFPAQNAHCIRGYINYDMIEKDTPAIKIYDALKDIKYTLNKEREENEFFSEDALFETWEDAVNDYTENFLTIPSSQRRFICLKDSWDIITDEIKVLSIDHLPKGIKFPTLGHPKTDVLYVVHPLRKDTYYPADNVDFELFRDQMREFVSIMESLGAKYIWYNDMQDSTRDEAHMSSHEVGGKVRVKAVEVAGDYQSGQENAKYTRFRQELEEKSEYHLGPFPTLPDENQLVWYHTRSDWQQKVESRLKGIRFRDKFRVNTSFEESISGKERLAIETEMKLLLNSASVKYNSDLSFSLKRTEERIWSVEVEFYPLQDYKKESQTISSEESHNNSENITQKAEEESNLFSRIKKLFN